MDALAESSLGTTGLPQEQVVTFFFFLRYGEFRYIAKSAGAANTSALGCARVKKPRRAQHKFPFAESTKGSASAVTVLSCLKDERRAAIRVRVRDFKYLTVRLSAHNLNYSFNTICPLIFSDVVSFRTTKRKLNAQSCLICDSSSSTDAAH